MLDLKVMGVRNIGVRWFAWFAVVALCVFLPGGPAQAADDKKEADDAPTKRRAAPTKRRAAAPTKKRATKRKPPARDIRRLPLPGKPFPRPGVSSTKTPPRSLPGRKIPGQRYPPLKGDPSLLRPSGRVPGMPAPAPSVREPARQRQRKIRVKPPAPRPNLRPIRTYKKDKELERIKRQLRADPIPIPPRLGGVFVPNITRRENVNPSTFLILDKRGKQVAVARTGKKAFVFPGWYTVKIGGQATDKLPTYKVRIQEGKLTIIRPRWAALIVRVVDSRLIQFRGTYDIIHLKSRRSVGTGLGADDTLGEKVKAWLLQPGQYMIVRVGDSHLARANYFTVQLNQGEVTRFRLVVDRNASSFIGGGVLLPQKELGSFSENSKWNLSLQLNGSFLWNQVENVQGSPSGHSFNLAAFLFGRLAYNGPKHFFLTTLNTELGFVLPSQGDLRKSSDRLELQAIYIYRLLKFLGPYVRAGIEISMFPEFFLFAPDDDRVLNASTIFVCKSQSCQITQRIASRDLKQFKLSGVFDPIALRQGIGINLQAVQQSYLNLRLLGGLGFRQELDREVFQFNEDNDISTLRCRDASKRSASNPLDLSGCPRPEEREAHTTVRLFEKLSTHREGIELALVATGQITRFLNFTTEFDALIQFNFEQFKLDIDWRSSVTLRLSHYASIIYRLRIKRDSTLVPDLKSPELSLWSLEQSLLLSFSLLL